MFVPVLVLLAAAALLWLSVFDRMSTLALAVVQVESSFGFPLWPPFLLAGGILLIFRILHARPSPAHPPRPLTRDAARTRPPGGPAPGDPPGAPAAPASGEPVNAPIPGGASNNWLATIREGARAVSDDPMGRVKFDDAAGVPIALVLTGVTREQARRRVAAYAAWLATIPSPPTARIRVVSSPDLEGPIHGLFRGELAKHFPADSVRVSSTHTGADAVFAHPDPRWSA